MRSHLLTASLASALLAGLTAGPALAGAIKVDGTAGCQETFCDVKAVNPGGNGNNSGGGGSGGGSGGGGGTGGGSVTPVFNRGSGGGGGGGGLTQAQLAAIAAAQAKIEDQAVRESKFEPCSGGSNYVEVGGSSSSCGYYNTPPKPVAAKPGETPAPPPPPDFTPEDALEQAIDRINLTPPNVGSAPCTDAGCQGTVGVPVWLWVNGGLPTDTATATAGPFTVTAVAKVRQVEWSLGDGQSTICTTAGTPYDKSKGWAASPDCGFPRGYQKVGNYTITASYVWDVTWSGAANGGASQTISTTQNVRVGEYQGLVVAAS